MAEDDKMTGGCACGAVRYEVRCAPLYSAHCRCRQCQRASGTGHSTLFIVPKNEMTLTGEVKYYDQKSDAGHVMSRGFCPACGSPVAGYSSGYPDNCMFTAASLDNPEKFEPKMIVFSKAGPHWDYMDPALIK